MQYSACISSHLQVSPAELWQWMTSLSGITSELAPWLSMSAPAGITSLESLKVEPGTRIFRSTLTLFGLIPIDYLDLTLLEIHPHTGFVEQSPMGSMRFWRHERTLEPTAQGCILTDRLVFEPRFAGAIVSPLVCWLFRHRHRQLRRRFGMVAG